MGRKSRAKKERPAAGSRAAGCETIEELRARVAEVCGPLHMGGTATPEIESEFLRQIIAFHEEENERVPLEMLAESGKVYRSPSDLDDEELARELARLVDDVAFLGIYLTSTDHLSDRELYEKLVGEILLEPTSLMPGNLAYGVHVDVIGGFSEEDIEIYLRYYAGESSRAHWRERFPGEEIPPKEIPPYDRDRFLPNGERRVSSPAS
ncbi:MAG TPA: hypothetical protein VMS56_02500 [Thermoanaerobaculia bacterium]|nr:hypothetical protein [Thermoanaerobaculia bacterium]